MLEGQANKSEQAARTDETRRSGLLWVLALILCGLGARFTLIRQLASPLPFWDAWEQARYVFAPYFEGKLTLAALFRSHNENRIVFARIYDLALLLWNRQWDGEVQMVSNCLLYVGEIAGFGCVLARILGRRLWPLISVTLTTILILPFAWENTLAGFHAQVYFMILISLITIWLLGFHRPGSLLWICGVISALCAPFTLLGGVFSPAAVFGLCFLRFLVKGRTKALLLENVPTMVVALIAVGIGLATRVEVAYHQVLKPHSVVQLVIYLGKYLSWPWIVLPPYAVFNWLPCLVLVWFYWKSERGGSGSRKGSAGTQIAGRSAVGEALVTSCPARAIEMVLALGLWAFLHGLTTSLARGGQAYPQWRYMDSACWVMVSNALALGLLVFRFRGFLPEYFRRTIRARLLPASGEQPGGATSILKYPPIPLVWGAAAVSGMVLLSGRAWMVDIPERENDLAHQLITMRAYLATGEARFLNVPRKEYLSRFAAPDEPQDHPQAMIDMLHKTGVREHMPACARDPLRLEPEAVSGFIGSNFATNSSGFAMALAATANAHSFEANAQEMIGLAQTIPGEMIWSSESTATPKARFESRELQSGLPFLEIRLQGTPDRTGLSLELIKIGSTKAVEVPLKGISTNRWTTVQVRVPAGPFKIVAVDEGPGWLAFQEPRELGGISWLSQRLLRLGAVLLGAGIVCFVIAFRRLYKGPQVSC